MGCGCNKKANQAQPQQTNVANQQTQQSPSIQESIKKVVEKYYTKKK